MADGAWSGSVGFIGAGAAAQALVRGVVAGGFLPPERIWVTNRGDEARLRAMAEWGAHATRSKDEVCRHADLLVLAVKPKEADGVLAEMEGMVREQHCLLTLMAGIPTSYIESRLGGGVRVLRAMPNTSSAVRASATAVARGRHATEADLACVMDLMAAVGQVLEVGEDDLDAVTALSGSGPAYVYLLMESLMEAGEAVGLAPDVVRRLVLQTAFGAAKLAVETERDPAELRARVSSPGGTTVAAIEVLEGNGFRGSLVQAVARAAERSRELGRAWAVVSRD